MDFPTKLLGNAVGGPASVRPVPEWDSQNGEPIRTGSALPSGCVHTLHDPFGKAECPWNCAGRQRDYSCLCDIVRACMEKGVTPEFEIDPEGYWTLIDEA